jgi:plasmid stabilization system protein ParE
MRISYFALARRDLRWYDQYYKQVFPEGALNAHAHYMRAIMLLLKHPDVGHEINTRGTRVWSISKTPFSLIYRVNNENIMVLRVWDNRRDRPER